MSQKKNIRIQNKSNKPDNIVIKEYEIEKKSIDIEKKLPNFLRGFFSYLKGNVLPMTRLAYLQDIHFFFKYILENTDFSDAEDTSKIKLEEICKIEAVDINIYMEYLRKYEKETEKAIYVFENNNRALARKKSSLSVLFKYMFRDGLLEKNITDGFNPIRLQKVGEREIKALEDDEVMIMLDSVSTGAGLTEKEYQYWEKTKKRDKAILITFLTYGLRLSELQQLNISSFNFNRGEFIIYRKRGKESVMPLNDSVTMALKDYIENERNSVIEEDALFLSLQGKRITDRQIRELVKKYTSIGMKTSRGAGYSPHKLRATTATSLIARGNSIFDVQALMDHEQVTTTQLYAAHKKNVKRDLVRGMEWEKERLEGTKDE